MARKSKETVELRGTWFWVWQHNRPAVYLNGVTRNEVATAYMCDHGADLGQTIYVVDRDTPTAHIPTAVDA